MKKSEYWQYLKEKFKKEGRTIYLDYDNEHFLAKELGLSVEDFYEQESLLENKRYISIRYPLVKKRGARFAEMMKAITRRRRF